MDCYGKWIFIHFLMKIQSTNPKVTRDKEGKGHDKMIQVFETGAFLLNGTELIADKIGRAHV